MGCDAAPAPWAATSRGAPPPPHPCDPMGVRQRPLPQRPPKGGAPPSHASADAPAQQAAGCPEAAPKSRGEPDGEALAPWRAAGPPEHALLEVATRRGCRMLAPSVSGALHPAAAEPSPSPGERRQPVLAVGLASQFVDAHVPSGSAGLPHSPMPAVPRRARARSHAARATTLCRRMLHGSLDVVTITAEQRRSGAEVGTDARVSIRCRNSVGFAPHPRRTLSKYDRSWMKLSRLRPIFGEIGGLTRPSASRECGQLHTRNMGQKIAPWSLATSDVIGVELSSAWPQKSSDNGRIGRHSRKHRPRLVESGAGRREARLQVHNI